MRQIKLDTGIIVTFDKWDNMIDLWSPYDGTEPVKMTKLRYYVKLIKKMI